MTLEELKEQYKILSAKLDILTGKEKSELEGLIVDIDKKIKNHPDYLWIQEYEHQQKNKFLNKIRVRIHNTKQKLGNWIGQCKRYIDSKFRR